MGTGKGWLAAAGLAGRRILTRIAESQALDAIWESARLESIRCWSPPAGSAILHSRFHPARGREMSMLSRRASLVLAARVAFGGAPGLRRAK